MPSIIKQNSAAQGKALSNRYTVKAFKHSDDMHRFLARGDNAMSWKETREDLRSGVYTSQVGYDRDAGRAVVTYHKA